MSDTKRSADHEIDVEEMIAWRQKIHRNPETAYTEFETAKLVSNALRSFGIEVHDGIAETGVVGVLTNGDSNKSIGLRADMDALDIEELNQFDHKSQVPGKMHACGHDGHTAMLLGAARYLAVTKNFDGTVYFIFQPAEENEGGGRRMVEEGLFERFPADWVFGMHNMPLLPEGSFALCSGPMMAAFATFECKITGVGAHSSAPKLGKSSISPAMQIVQAWDGLVLENFSAREDIVVSTTKFHAGDAWNVLPETATIGGSTRCFSEEIARELEQSMGSIAKDIATTAGVTCEFEYVRQYPPLIHDKEAVALAVEAAKSLVPEGKVDTNLQPLMGSEDFAYMLQEKRGAYILISNNSTEDGGCMVHNPYYDFNDEILELGAKYWISLVEKYLD